MFLIVRFCPNFSDFSALAGCRLTESVSLKLPVPSSGSMQSSLSSSRLEEKYYNIDIK